MKHAVLLLARNGLSLTKSCLNTIIAQDIPVSVFVIDNQSSDGTEEWLSSDEYKGVWQRFDPQLGVSEGWNFGLNTLFHDPIWNAEYVLVPNSDTELPPWLYRRLLDCEQGFVTGVSVGSREVLAEPPPVKKLVESPDMSCFCISRQAWMSIGEFDSSMFLYASDLDFHLRAWRKGIHLWNAGVPFYHVRSSTIRLASSRDRREIELQADADRETFTRKWNLPPGGPQYAAAFTPETFGIDHPMIQEM